MSTPFIEKACVPDSCLPLIRKRASVASKGTKRVSVGCFFLASAFFFLASPVSAAPCSVVCSDNTRTPQHVELTPTCEAAACAESCLNTCRTNGGCFASSCEVGTGTAIPTSECVATALASSHTPRTTTLSNLARISQTLRVQTSTFTCQSLTAFDTSRCVVNGCRGASDYCCTPNTSNAPATGSGTATSTSCGANAVRLNRNAAQTLEASTHIPSDQWACQRVTDDALRTRLCFTAAPGACPGCDDRSVLCCAPGAGEVQNQCTGRPAAGLGGGTSSRTSGGSSPSLPNLLPSCISDGKCQISDLVNTGVNFANILIGLSGAVFMAIFVYAGFKYVFFAYDSGEAGKAKTMLVQATIGMLLILGSTLIVKFVRQTFIGDRCLEQAGPNYACQDVSSLNARARRDLGCRTNLCPGGDNDLCCRSGSAPSP